MIPYFLLLLIPCCLTTVCMDRTADGHRQILIGSTQKVKETNLAIPAFFLLLLLMLMFRSDSVGIDLKNYRYLFYQIGQSSVSDILSAPSEVLFRLLTWGLYRLTGSYQVYLAAAACIALLPLWAFYARNRRHAALQILLFVNMSTFVMLFSGIRQSMAIALGVWVFDCIRRRKLWTAAALTAAAFLVHTSAFMLLFLYPLQRMRLKRIHLLWLLPAMGLLLVCNRQVFGFLTALLSDYTGQFNLQASSTGAYGSLLLFSLLTVFVWVIGEEAHMDDEAFALRNILLFAAMLQCFAPLHPLAMRMNYYFIVLIPAAVGKILATPRKPYAGIARWGERVLSWFFSLYFCYGIWQAGVTGISLLNTVPYLPFWAK